MVKCYLGELNPRVTGASSITNHAVFALADIPLYLFHILDYMDVDYDLSVNAINQRWGKQENIDGWSQLVIKPPGILWSLCLKHHKVAFGKCMTMAIFSLTGWTHTGGP
ncbi:MAG: hypothetical protein U5L96_06790 [Owenweeksia sp.]|nr:hypothetical protein [Owenweeksia sp.]